MLQKICLNSTSTLQPVIFQKVGKQSRLVRSGFWSESSEVLEQMNWVIIYIYLVLKALTL